MRKEHYFWEEKHDMQMMVYRFQEDTEIYVEGILTLFKPIWG